MTVLLQRRAAALLLVLGLLLATVSPASAQQGDVPADARWYVQIDVPQLLESQVGRHMLAKRGLTADGDRATRFTDRFGFNPLRDLERVTLFHYGFDEGEGTAILRGTFDQEKLVAEAQKAPDYAAVQVHEQDAHRVGFVGRGGEKTAWLAFVGEDVAVISSSEGGLSGALELLAGEDEPADADDALLSPRMPGTFLHLGAVDLEGLPRHSRLLEVVEAMTLAVGEEEGELFTHHRITTDTPESAARFKEMFDGMKAFFTLRQGEDAPLVKLLANASLDLDDNQITVNWFYDAAELLELTEQWRANHGH